MLSAYVYAMMQFKNPEEQLARWIEHLQTSDFSIEHRRDIKHGNADALSLHLSDVAIQEL